MINVIQLSPFRIYNKSKLMIFVIGQILLSLCAASLNSVEMQFGNNTNLTIYSSGSLSSLFINKQSSLSCVQSPTYILKQNSTQLANNSFYTISINTDSYVSINITTKYNNFQPTFSPQYCSSSCNVIVNNNCAQSMNPHNYFDFLTLSITDMPNANYRVWCDQTYKPPTFQWGLFLLIICITVLISVSALYSRAWSIGGRGIKINYWFVLALNIIWIVGVLLGAFVRNITYFIVIALSWVLGVICVGFCINEILWLFKNQKINSPFLWIVRPIDIISFCVGLGVVSSWWFTEMNWISSDIIGVCSVIAFVKCFKFTSMKMATIMLSSILVIEVVVALIIQFAENQSYNNILINQFNNPMFLQLPCINQLLNQRCAWIPVTEVIFPGIFLSYLRRFDDSRNTRVYIIVGCVAFYIGSMVWMTMTTLNRHAWPFALFSETLLFIVVSMFATKRNEIRTIWNGKFYDAEFADIYQMNQLKKTFAENDFNSKEVQMRQSIFQGLRASGKQTGNVVNSSHNNVNLGNVI